MKHTLVIARRDLADRGSLFIAAAAAAVLPFLLPLFPATASFGTKDVITTSGAVIAAAFTMLLAFVLGVTMIGRDLSEKRMSFYFSKPLGTSSIWFGKLIAAVITIALSFGIVFLPNYILSPKTWGATVNLQAALSNLVPVCLALLLGGHALSTMFRSRSPLVIVDLLLTCAGFYLFGWMQRALHQGFAFDLMEWFREILASVVLLILAGCGLWQLERGRADRLQHHLALSRSLWTAMAIVLGAASAYVAWVVHPSLKDLREPRVFQAPRGSWVMITGETRHRGGYRAWFLYDTAKGKSIRLQRTTHFRDLWFSRDGKTFGYFQSEAPDRDFELVVMPLRENAKPVNTGFMISRGGRYTFSDDGGRIIFFDDRQIASVYDIKSRKSIASVRLPAEGLVRAFFVNPDLVRIYVQTPPSVKDAGKSIAAYELDVRTKVLRKLGEHYAAARMISMTVSQDGTRGLILEHGTESGACLVDARTLERRAEFPSSNFSRMTFLADGGVGALSVSETTADVALDVYGPDAVLRRHIAVGHAKRVWVSDELSGGRLIVIGSDYADTTEGPFTAWVVDYNSGRVVKSIAGLRDAGSFPSDWFGVDPRHNVAEADRATITSTSEGLLSWQSLTGATKELVFD